jgi:hypothetical protein
MFIRDADAGGKDQYRKKCHPRKRFYHSISLPLWTLIILPGFLIFSSNMLGESKKNIKFEAQNPKPACRQAGKPE